MKKSGSQAAPKIPKKASLPTRSVYKNANNRLETKIRKRNQNRNKDFSAHRKKECGKCRIDT
jgi:hypothetical protein